MARKTEPDPDLARLNRLRALVARAERGAGKLGDEELLELPRLYRHACSLSARLESADRNPRVAAEARRVVGRAHALLFRPRDARRRPWTSALLELFLRRSPRAIRAEWRLLATTAGLVYGLALLSWTAVSGDLDLASSLLSPEAVEHEIEQLRETGPDRPFRGNFTFGLGESPATAGWIMVHNMGVGVLFFASALIPPIYVLVLGTNGLMLGTYTAVAGHWGQAGAISSILWCHGVLEIQALILAGTAGLVLVRAWVRPGPFTRRFALQRESRRSLQLLAPVFPLLFLAGMIEGFVSPHAPTPVRLTVAAASGAMLLAWALLGGRGARRPGSATRG